MRTHGREPFKGIKDLFLFPIFGTIGHLGFHLTGNIGQQTADTQK
jgi:hypothetical protein